jgi:hypothetical protein
MGNRIFIRGMTTNKSRDEKASKILLDFWLLIPLWYSTYRDSQFQGIVYDETDRQSACY